MCGIAGIVDLAGRRPVPGGVLAAMAAALVGFVPVALQSVVNAYFLLSDKEALEGLRDKSLALRADRYTFAVLDPSTGISYSWTSATGLSRLSKPDVSAPKAIKLGFDFSAQQNGPQWSAPFNREPGTCYSVNVLVVQ